MEINFVKFVFVNGVTYTIGEEVNTGDFYIRNNEANEIYKIWDKISFDDKSICDYIIKYNI